MAPVGYRARMTQHPSGPPLPAYAITKQRRRTSHGLHLFLTMITGGAWGLLVWLPLTMWHKMGPKQKVKTRYR